MWPTSSLRKSVVMCSGIPCGMLFPGMRDAQRHFLDEQTVRLPGHVGHGIRDVLGVHHMLAARAPDIGPEEVRIDGAGTELPQT